MELLGFVKLSEVPNRGSRFWGLELRVSLGLGGFGLFKAEL